MDGIKRIKLTDGIYLNAVTTGRFKTDYLSFNAAGALAPKDNSSKAALCALLRRGCRRYPDSRAIGRIQEELYGARLFGRVRKKGELQFTGIGIEIAAEEYALAREPLFCGALEFIKELLFNPLAEGGSFKPEFVESEKVNLINAIEAEKNDKMTWAVTRAHELMCEGEPFALNEKGDRASVERLDGRGLYDYYKRCLESSAVEIVYVGASPAQEVAQKLAEVFGELPPRAEIAAAGAGLRGIDGVREFVEELPVKQGKLTLGFRTSITAPSADYPALVAANAIFGATPASKLFMNVRERLSLCYYCSSRIESAKGIVTVSSGIENANERLARGEILKQLAEVQAGNFTEEDLDNAAVTLGNLYRSLSDSAASLEDYILSCIAAGSIESPERMAERFARVTREDAVRAARTIELDTVYFLKGGLAQ